MAEAQTIRLSFNEIEQLCLKAARGAGLSWGLAEEAGMAASWLALRGIDGPRLLTQRLSLGPLADPIIPWKVQTRLQCPIALGASLSDHAGLSQTSLQGGAIDLGRVVTPLLLLPFIARLCVIKGHAIVFTSPAGRILVTASGEIDPGVANDGPADHFASPSKVQIAKSPAREPARAPAWAPENGRPSYVGLSGLSAATFGSLGLFATRTTVPASEASRAGAGASDGDAD